MSNIDKQALRERAESTIGILENIAGFEPSDIDGDTVELRFETEDGFDTGCEVSIVDQCQKAADVIRALLDELEAAENRITELERSETQLIGERDDAEAALNDAYKAVMGQAPEWSNWFSFADAIDEIELACGLWRNQTEDVIQFRARIAELEAREVKLPPKAPDNLASCLDGYEKWLIATTFRDTWNACLAEVVRVNAAAGKGE